MAEAAKLSKYHFSRVFSACLHETPNQYVMRVRLERTAVRLARSYSGNITQIALDFGYSGSDTFARSFKQRFGCSPRAFKTINQYNPGEIQLNSALTEGIIKPGENVLIQDFAAPLVEIQQRPEYCVAYIRHFGPYGGKSIPATFERLEQWAQARGISPQTSSFLGQSYDSCSVTAARQCTFDACIVLDDFVKEDDIVSVQTVPGGLFAVCNVVCEAPQINRMWDWLYEYWLPMSGYRARPIPPYEFYPAPSDFIIQPSRGKQISLQLCLPIVAI